MSKKKILAGILLIVLAVLANAYVLLYRAPLDYENVNINVTIKADEDSVFQMFYWNQEDPDGISFTENRSTSVAVARDNDTDDVYSFKIPADTKYIRFDLGTCENDIEITGMTVSYKGYSADISVDKLSDYMEASDVKAGSGTAFVATSDDPYLVLDVRDWGIDQVISAYRESPVMLVSRIIACLLIDAIVVLALRRFGNLIAFAKELVHNRRLIRQLSRNDFKTRYAASFFGIFWAFLQPVITVLVYWFVFEKGLKAGSQSLGSIDAPFLLFLISGLVPWFFFSDALNGATSSLTSYTYLVKKVVFDIDILPLVKVISALYVHLFFMLMAVIICFGYGNRPTLILLQLLYYSAALMINVIGLGYLTSAIVVFFRDLSEIINIVLSIGVWVTPIMWNVETTLKSDVLKMIFQINPLYYIVQGYRDTLISGVWFWERPGLTIYYWILTILVFVLGKRTFTKLKIHFSDVL